MSVAVALIFAQSESGRFMPNCRYSREPCKSTPSRYVTTLDNLSSWTGSSGFSTHLTVGRCFPRLSLAPSLIFDCNAFANLVALQWFHCSIAFLQDRLQNHIKKQAFPGLNFGHKTATTRSMLKGRSYSFLVLQMIKIHQNTSKYLMNSQHHGCWSSHLSHKKKHFWSIIWGNRRIFWANRKIWNPYPS